MKNRGDTILINHPRAYRGGREGAFIKLFNSISQREREGGNIDDIFDDQGNIPIGETNSL